MHDFLIQHKNSLILFTGCFLIPALFVPALLYIGFSERNISGLLNEPAFFPFVHIAGLFMLGWLVFLLYTLSKKYPSRLKPVPSLILLCVLIIAALTVGYSDSSGFIGLIHILLAYGGFVWMNVLFYAWARYERTYVNIYFCLCFTAFILSVGLGYVSGISEVLYAAGCSVLLSLCAVNKKGRQVTVSCH